MSLPRTSSIKVTPGEVCEAPFEGLRWVDIAITIPIPTAVEEGQTSQDAPIQQHVVNLRTTIPAISKGANVEAAAYGYGQMIARQVADLIAEASKNHRVDPALDQ
jgi:hypothetical protein